MRSGVRTLSFGYTLTLLMNSSVIHGRPPAHAGVVLCMLISRSYCNSILQCLYYSVPFREQVISYPKPTPYKNVTSDMDGKMRLDVNATALPPTHPSLAYSKLMNKVNQTTTARNPGTVSGNQKEDKDHPDYKKRVALARGPTIAMTYDNARAYDMPESLFTSLKDVFDAIYAHKSRTGIVSPRRFLEVLRRENEMFRSAMHQDAHEFLNLLLNEVVENVEAYSKNLEATKEAKTLNGTANGHVEKTGFERALATAMHKTNNNTGWVHELFEGTLTSETKCLTCENVSQRDEAFLDLSVDLDEHTSVTSCLRKFSEEEMLCERNKFHCDGCGGLQEAEKRMKIKRLPRILALHLKRFKYTEDLQRLQKLFHRVVYPYHLRLFNTTDDAEDPDRLYELYAVVVHIGGGPYHGHYVSIIKTQDRGWLLFDDELVEPVDKSYVQNFFGDRPGLACAYVLFYQETTLEAVKKEQDAESSHLTPKPVVEAPKEPVGLGLKTNGFMNGLHHVKSAVSPMSPDEGLERLDKAVTLPSSIPSTDFLGETHGMPPVPIVNVPGEDIKSKKERAKEDKDRRAKAKEEAKEAEKAEKERRKTLEIQRKEISKKTDVQAKAAIEASKHPKAENDQLSAAPISNGMSGNQSLSSGLSRFKSTSKSFKKPKFFGSVREPSREVEPGDENIAPSVPRLSETADRPNEKTKSKAFSNLRKRTSLMKM